ncbi:MAG: dihydropteroate synthase [Syntrophomonas sp.]|uniref:dihydropteroate synthase n=1 Tax=Syntrophomonas sp. TaxID=2053627 RepID=UPI0026111CF4|nr:dihydropteroate synthase [Syntrophomonas sp.]MDD2510450.1 dihydropteroate synthase [Syntrophomonas sp.]MDD4626706.1 dihydropteroate synthase [Syntrophomonas sp.]
MQQGHHAVLIHDRREAQRLLQEIAVDSAAFVYLLPKAVFRCIKLKEIPCIAANIIKQEMLAKGGEAAVKREALYLEGTTDVLLLGTLKHYGLLLEKLKKQPFGLKKIAAEIQTILDNLEARERTIALAHGKELSLNQRTLIMGILNVTPDSFSDGGRYMEAGKAVERARKMREEGADIIDIGGASSRPQSQMIDEAEELRRVLPVVKSLSHEGFILSLDTFRAGVARACLDEGVHLINDIGCLQLDPGLLPVLVEKQAPVILMHNRMQVRDESGQVIDAEKITKDLMHYQDIISDIIKELGQSIEMAREAGLAREKMIIDPGLGFGKNTAQNRLLIKRLEEFKSLGQPLLIGASRKTFIGQTLDLEVEQRLEGSLAIVAMAIMNAADIVRVHDVRESKRVAMMTDAVVRENG